MIEAPRPCARWQDELPGPPVDFAVKTWAGVAQANRPRCFYM
jgi:hypothetical protein